jgi:hypothetical protein
VSLESIMLGSNRIARSRGDISVEFGFPTGISMFCAPLDCPRRQMAQD